MAWKTPQTWTSGQGVWVYDLNREIRDRTMTLRNLNDFAARISLSSAQSVPTSENVPVRWDTLDWSASGGSSLLWTGGPNLLAPVAGWYELDFKLSWASGETSGGVRLGRYVRSDSTNTRYELVSMTPLGTALPSVQSALATIKLTTADSIVVEVYQNCGDDLTLIGSTGDRSRCTWRLLGGAT